MNTYNNNLHYLLEASYTVHYNNTLFNKGEYFINIIGLRDEGALCIKFTDQSGNSDFFYIAQICDKGEYTRFYLQSEKTRNEQPHYYGGDKEVINGQECERLCEISSLDFSEFIKPSLNKYKPTLFIS